MRISDWSSDVCSSDLIAVYDAYADAWAIIHANLREALEATRIVDTETGATLNSGAKSAALSIFEGTKQRFFAQLLLSMKLPSLLPAIDTAIADGHAVVVQRSEEHTSELQSLMRISYAVFCL